MRRLVADCCTAPFALMDDDISLLRVGKNLYWAENAAAGVGSVARVYINVKGTEAKGTMIARGYAKR